jgi:SWI/SNF-related matrix-associated actin-dependent regulator 1 of chromatin subfamily A
VPLDVFPYQDEGAAYLASRYRAGLLDEPGAGKTATGVRACDRAAARRIWVMCPAAVREHWRSDFLRFQHYPRRICKGENIHDFSAWRQGRFDVLVTSYEQGAKWATYLIEDGEYLDAAIFDEAHYLKDANTKRVKKFLGEEVTGHTGLLSQCCRAWWLTGSPIPNDPADIYTFLRFCDVMPLSRDRFVERYFTSRPRSYGNSAQTAIHDMVREIQTLIGNNSIRRRLIDVGIQLPPIFLTNMLIDGDTGAVRDMLMEHPGLDRMIIDALESGKGLGALADQTDKVATLRRLIGEAKALPYAQMLRGEIEGGLEKVVFFGLHRNAMQIVIDYLGKHGVRCGLINGATHERDRVTLVNSFQTEPSMKVLGLQMRSGGTGLTLTAAAAEDIFESDWAPYVNAQALKRIHRIGQTKACRARFITLANSFDGVVNEIVAAKTASIAEIEGAAVLGGAAPQAA